MYKLIIENVLYCCVKDNELLIHVYLMLEDVVKKYYMDSWLVSNYVLAGEHLEAI